MILLETLLEDFGSVHSAPSTGMHALSDEDFESQRLASFEEGYKAGWDDAIKAHSDDQTRISADFAQNLSDLSFTYHEAYAQVVAAMQPLLEQIVEKLLPEMARVSLGPKLVDELLTLAKSQPLDSVELVIAPQDRSSIEPLLTGGLGFPVTLIEDDLLLQGQAQIRFGETERQVDLKRIVSGIEGAIDGFFTLNNKDVANG